jgi:thioredoxin
MFDAGRWKTRFIDKFYEPIESVCWRIVTDALPLHQKKKERIKTEKIMTTINLTKGGFLRKVADFIAHPGEWKFKGERPALIDFYAPWCGPCKSLSPVLDELAKEYAGKVDIYKVNVEAEPELASLFRIRTIPTLVFAPMNGDPHIASGAPTKGQLKKALEAFVG